MVITKLTPYIVAVLLSAATGFLTYNWGKTKGEAEKVVIEANFKATIDSLRLSHEVEALKIRLEYAKKADFIHKATPEEIDSLFTSYGF